MRNHYTNSSMFSVRVNLCLLTVYDGGLSWLFWPQTQPVNKTKREGLEANEKSVLQFSLLANSYELFFLPMLANMHVALELKSMIHRIQTLLSCKWSSVLTVQSQNIFYISRGLKDQS